eukprot:m.59476 g.59476  ORF g.59476 m.59476 type:complete len:1073 (+) comp22714_c1_seq1:170-3388(+)
MKMSMFVLVGVLACATAQDNACPMTNAHLATDAKCEKPCVATCTITSKGYVLKPPSETCLGACATTCLCNTNFVKLISSKDPTNFTCIPTKACAPLTPKTTPVVQTTTQLSTTCGSNQHLARSDKCESTCTDSCDKDMYLVEASPFCPSVCASGCLCDNGFIPFDNGDTELQCVAVSDCKVDKTQFCEGENGVQVKEGSEFTKNFCPCFCDDPVDNPEGSCLTCSMVQCKPDEITVPTVGQCCASTCVKNTTIGLCKSQDDCCPGNFCGTGRGGGYKTCVGPHDGTEKSVIDLKRENRTCVSETESPTAASGGPVPPPTVAPSTSSTICPHNSVPDKCTSACVDTCNATMYFHPNPGQCKDMCRVGCTCNPGYAKHPAPKTKLGYDCVNIKLCTMPPSTEPTPPPTSKPTHDTTPCDSPCLVSPCKNKTCDLYPSATCSQACHSPPGESCAAEWTFKNTVVHCAAQPTPAPTSARAVPTVSPTPKPPCTLCKQDPCVGLKCALNPTATCEKDCYSCNASWTLDRMPVDCEAKYDCNTKEIWSEDKQEWCCENENKGCGVSSPECLKCVESGGFWQMDLCSQSCMIPDLPCRTTKADCVQEALEAKMETVCPTYTNCATCAGELTRLCRWSNATFQNSPAKCVMVPEDAYMHPYAFIEDPNACPLEPTTTQTHNVSTPQRTTTTGVTNTPMTKSPDVTYTPVVTKNTPVVTTLETTTSPKEPPTPEPFCRAINGTLMPEGSRWQQDACTTCTCDKPPASMCMSRSCPRPQACDPGFFFVTQPGECCGSCQPGKKLKLQFGQELTKLTTTDQKTQFTSALVDALMDRFSSNAGVVLTQSDMDISLSDLPMVTVMFTPESNVDDKVLAMMVEQLHSSSAPLAVKVGATVFSTVSSSAVSDSPTMSTTQPPTPSPTRDGVTVGPTVTDGTGTPRASATSDNTAPTVDPTGPTVDPTAPTVTDPTASTVTDPTTVFSTDATLSTSTVNGNPGNPSKVTGSNKALGGSLMAIIIVVVVLVLLCVVVVGVLLCKRQNRGGSQRLQHSNPMYDTSMTGSFGLYEQSAPDVLGTNDGEVSC